MGYEISDWNELALDRVQLWLLIRWWKFGFHKSWEFL